MTTLSRLTDKPMRPCEPKLLRRTQSSPVNLGNWLQM